MTTNKLKLTALILMLIDHIGLFIPHMPVFLNILGRASAPIFIFCTVLGFGYTHSKKVYLIRMYIFSLLMGFIDFFLNNLFKYPYMPSFNNIFSTLFIICLSIFIWEKLDTDKNKKIKFIGFIILNIILMYISNFIILISNNINLSTIIYGMFPTLFTCEGFIIIASLGFVFYFCKNDRKSILKGYSIYCLLIFLLTILQNTPYLTNNVMPWGKYLFSFNIQWLQIWALPFILSYNGKKGINMKYFFYIFYPLHIVILFILGNIIKF